MKELFFSRIRLKKDSHVRAIADLLLPQGGKENLNARHKLIWSLFSDNENRTRDFLWREDKYGEFFTLSTRQPQDKNNMFNIESKPFEPNLAAGDSLIFSLRANPVVSRRGASEGKRRGKRIDVVMDRLKPCKQHDPDRGDPGERRFVRDKLIVEAGQGWLKQQGVRYGFHPDLVRVDGYHQHILPRKGGKRPGNISTLDFEGRLTVTDPDKFLARLTTGFGSAKAFGCGLMMIRRA